MVRLSRTEERALAADRPGPRGRPPLAGCSPSRASAAPTPRSDVQHLLAEQLDELGLDVDLWPIDLAGSPRPPASPARRPSAPRRGGSSAPGAGDGSVPALVLQGHVDVVPPGDLAHWAGDPFEPPLVDGGRCTAAAPAT